MIHVLVSIPVLFALRKTVGLGTGWAALAACTTALGVFLLGDILHRRFELPWQRSLNRRVLPTHEKLAARHA